MLQRCLTLFNQETSILIGLILLLILRKEVEVCLKDSWVILRDLTHFSETRHIHYKAPRSYELCLSESLVEFRVTLDVKVFSVANLYCQVGHRLSKTEHLNLDLKPIVNHNVELANFTDYIDDLSVEILVINDGFVKCKAVLLVSDD